MKRKCFVFLFSVFSLLGLAQNKKIDTANMLCSYVYEYLTDTLSGEQLRKEDLLYLQIGAECSKCYSYYTYLCDSLMASRSEERRVGKEC